MKILHALNALVLAVFVVLAVTVSWGFAISATLWAILIAANAWDGHKRTQRLKNHPLYYAATAQQRFGDKRGEQRRDDSRRT